MAEECDYLCKQETDFKQLLFFQGEVAASLKNIERDISELKNNSKDDSKYLWNAVNKIKDDIKNLYWKVGFISGGTALLISLMVRFIEK